MMIASVLHDAASAAPRLVTKLHGETHRLQGRGNGRGRDGKREISVRHDLVTSSDAVEKAILTAFVGVVLP
jgi:hypothetical protein